MRLNTKSVHYPRASGRKTACGIHMLWDAFEYHGNKYTSSRTDAVLAQQAYDIRSPINVLIVVHPGHHLISCRACKKSEVYQQDLLEYEFSRDIPGFLEAWPKRFVRGPRGSLDELQAKAGIKWVIVCAHRYTKEQEADVSNTFDTFGDAQTCCATRNKYNTAPGWYFTVREISPSGEIRW